MDTPFFTWDTLYSMGGASLLVFFVVQYSKSLLDRVLPKLPTDVVAVAVAFGVLVLAQLAQGADAADWRLYALAFANAFLVAAAAGHVQNKVVNPPGASMVKPSGATATATAATAAVPAVQSGETEAA